MEVLIAYVLFSTAISLLIFLLAVTDNNKLYMYYGWVIGYATLEENKNKGEE